MWTAGQVQRQEASGDDLHSALGRSSAKDAVAPLTVCKAMAKRPEGSEVRLRLAERAASPVEGHFRTLPEGPNGGCVPGDVHQQGARLVLTRSDVSHTFPGGPLGLRTPGILESLRRRRCRPQRDEDRDGRRDDRRDHRGDESVDRDRDRRRDRRRSERDRDRDRARGGRGRRRRDDSR